MKLCLSSLLLAAATTVSMADPIVSNDKNLRALRAEDVRDGHGGHGGHGHGVSTCTVAVKMMGYLGLAGGKWDKIMSKACPGMSWGSHLASIGVCDASPRAALDCGVDDSFFVGDMIHSVTCWEPQSEARVMGSMRTFVEMPRDLSDQMVVDFRVIMGTDASWPVLTDMADVTTLEPIFKHRATINSSGWTTAAMNGVLVVPANRGVCVDVAIRQIDPQRPFVVAQEQGMWPFDRWALVSNQCPERVVLREVSERNFCNEVFMGPH